MFIFLDVFHVFHVLVDCFSLYIIFLLYRLLVLADCCCFLVVYYIFCRNALFGRLDFFDQTSPEAADIYLQHVVFAANEAAEAVPGWKIWAARFLGFQAARGSTFAEIHNCWGWFGSWSTIIYRVSWWWCFKDFLFSPRTLGEKIQFDEHISFRWVAQPPTSYGIPLYCLVHRDTFNGLLLSSIVQLDNIIPCKALGIFFSKIAFSKMGSLLGVQSLHYQHNIQISKVMNLMLR